MNMPTRKELMDELAELRLRLEEAEDTLRAIRQGDLEVLEVSTPEGEKVFTLKEADHSYRVLVETINEGVATLTRDGTILYANRGLADLLQTPLEKVRGSRIHDYMAPQDRPVFEALLQLRQDNNRGEVRLKAANGREVPVLVSLSLLPLEEMPDKLCLVVTDLTEQKRQEEILVAERLSRAILDQVEQAIVVCNDRGVITQASQAAQRLFDGNPLLQRFEEAFPPVFQVQENGADFPEGGFPLTGVLQGVIYQGVEAVFQRRDGQEFHVILNAGPLTDENGEVLGGIVSLTDITVRKQAEEALRTQARILESMAEGVSVTDWRGYILYTNPAFDAMFGYEPGELVGRHSNTLNYYPLEDNLRVVKKIVRQVNTGGVWSGEFHNCRKDGGSFFSSARISALEVWGKKLYISVQEDITERRRQQEVLRRQAELLDLAEDAILVRDMLGRITYWNRGAEELYGWSREEAMGQVVHRLLHTEYPEPLLNIETQVMEQGRWEGEVIHTTRDGRRLMVDCRWSLKQDEQGRPLAILDINNDVTARRQAEEALSRSESRFRKLVEANIIGIAVSDEETVVEANEAFLRMLGYTREEMYAGEINWVELTPHDYLSQDAQALYELRTTGAHTPFEKAFIRRNGSQVSVMVGGALLEEDPLIWVSFVVDISERKQLEAALRQSEARFRAIFSNASIGIATTDLKGYFQQFNAPVVKGLGYTPTELRGMTFFEVTHPEDIHKDADLFAELAAGRRERYQVEKRYVRKDGRVLWGRVHVSLARNMAGDPEFAVSLVEDITARQEAQAGLAESEARYRSLVEMSPDAIVVHAKGRIIFANQTGFTLFGAASPEDILGQHILDLVHPDFQEIVKRRVKRGYAGERADLREIKLRRFDGQTIDVESSATPITYQGQSAVQVVVRDISERKQAEEEIRRLASFPELNPLPVMEVDEEGRVLYANPAAQRVAANLGLPEGVRAFMPENLKEIFATVRGGGPRRYSYDREFDKAAYAVTLHFPHDLPTARLYAMDITERRRAEEALQHSEARERARAIELQTILDATPGVILLAHDPEGRVITGNRAAYELMRQPPGSNLSKSSAEGERPENFRTMQNGREITGAELPVQRAASGETVRNFEVDMVFDDGTVRHTLGDAVPLPDEAGQPRGAVAVFLDITERKRMKEALARRQAEFEAIFNSISDGVIFADLERRIVMTNPAAETLFGYAREEMQGRTTEFIYASPADYQEQGRLRYHTRPDHPHPVYEIDYRRQDGSVFPAESRGTQVKDAQGRVIGFVSIHRDITERKQAEEERSLTIKVLDLINSPITLHELTREVTKVFQEWSGCEAVGLRLRAGEDFPYFETRGFPVEFVELENRLCARDQAGELIRDSEGNPVIECMCGNVICGRFNPELPFFTPGGSFWTNSTTQLLGSTTDQDRQARTRNRCHGEGYESVALVPLNSGMEALGLLQFNDRAQGKFTLEKIQLFERIADNLASGIARRQAEEALRESREDLNRAQAVAHTGSWRLNVRKNELTWSEENYRIFGIPPGRPLTYETFLGAVHPEDREYVDGKWTAALEGEPYDIQHRIVLSDTVKWVRERAELEFDAEGRLLGGFGTAQDITERKRAEEELARQRELLQTIIDNIPVMLTFYDPNLKIFRFNKELRRVLGWSEEDLAAMDDPLEFFYPNPEQRQQVREYMLSLVPGWRDFQATARDGSLVDSTWANIRLTDDTHIGIGVDIRERKRAEEALQRQYKLIQGINLVLLEALTCETAEDLGRTCLAVAEELTGSRFGFLGEINEAGLLDDIAVSDPGWEACTVPGSQDLVLPQGWHIHGIYGQVLIGGQSLIANDPAAHPDRIGLPEGHPPLTAFLGVPLKQGDKTIGMIGLGNKPGGYTPADQDAVEALSLAMVEAFQRQRAEAALRQSEARYRAIGELIPYGIWTAGTDGGWDYVSKSFLKMAGKTLEECRGFGWLHLLPYEDSQPALKAWQYCLETGGFWDYEYKIRGKDGSYRTILSRGLPLADERGRITSWVGINLDITERKEMEEALRRAHKELEKRVQERTAALRLANEELLGEIKERQKVENRLRRSEDRFTAFMKHMPGAAVMRDIQGRYLFANETWERLAGQAQEEWPGKTADDIWPPMMARTIKEADFTILSTGQPAEHLEELELADGRHYFLTHRFPIQDEDGLPYMVGSIAVDVTARQRAEEDLAAERQRLLDLLENLPAFVYLQAPDYSLRFANREFRQRFGEPDGGTCYSLLWGREEPCPECPTFLVFYTGQAKEWEWTAPDGHIYQVYDYPFKDVDGSPLVLEMGIDITRRKQAEMAAAQQAALVAGINRILREALTCETEEELGRTCLTVAEELSGSRFGFVDLVNEAGNLYFLTVSDPGWAACRMFDIKDLSHLQNIPPKGLVAATIRYGRALMANDPASHPDAAGTPAGHPHLTAYLGVPLTHGDQTIGIIGVGNKTGGYSDTDRETMEILAPSIVEALMHHRAAKDLKISESKLRFLADQLLTAQENERKRLASELHDELGHALLALKLALSSIAKELMPTQEDLKQDIQDQLEYINGVINEVRRLYHDLIPGNVEDLGLTKALRTLVEDFADLWEDIDCQVDLPNLDGLFSLPVQTIIYRLVQEALTNIGKHAEPSQVTVSAAPEEGRVHFVIQDDGAGFDVSEGLHHAGGLGLVAMEERLNMVGGTFEVWSEKGEGTKICFTIPTRPREERK